MREDIEARYDAAVPNRGSGASVVRSCTPFGRVSEFTALLPVVLSMESPVLPVDVRSESPFDVTMRKLLLSPSADEVLTVKSSLEPVRAIVSEPPAGAITTLRN